MILWPLMRVMLLKWAVIIGLKILGNRLSKKAARGGRFIKVKKW